MANKIKVLELYLIIRLLWFIFLCVVWWGGVGIFFFFFFFGGVFFGGFFLLHYPQQRVLPALVFFSVVLLRASEGASERATAVCYGVARSRSSRFHFDLCVEIADW